MGVGFNWFKSYQIIENEFDYLFGKDVEYRIEYLDGNSTSHSYGNRSMLQDIFIRYFNAMIPNIPCYSENGNYYKDLNLINPTTMSEFCSKLIDNTEKYDLESMKDRIEWIKKISDQGYYISYDVE